MNVYGGIEIGGSKLQLVSGNGEGQIFERARFNINRAEGAAGIRKLIEEGLHIFNQHSIKSIGVGFGGPVDRSTNSVYTSYHIEGWSGFEITKWLQQLTGVPVFIENDANIAALAEAVCGAGKNYNLVFYVTLGSGTGGGLVINKKIYNGACPGESEIGHMRLDKTGRIVESSCSGWSVNEKMKRAAANNPESKLAALIKKAPGAEAKVLLEAMFQQDNLANTIFDETTDDLAFALSHVVQLLHPETIILGGGLSLIGEKLRQAVAGKLVNYIMNAFQPGPLIQLAALKEDAVPVGSLIFAHSQLPG